MDTLGLFGGNVHLREPLVVAARREEQAIVIDAHAGAEPGQRRLVAQIFELLCEGRLEELRGEGRLRRGDLERRPEEEEGGRARAFEGRVLGSPVWILDPPIASPSPTDPTIFF